MANRECPTFFYDAAAMSRAAAYVVDDDLSIIYCSKMNERVRCYSWSSRCHGQKAAPVSPVTSKNEGNPRKRLSGEETNEKPKKAKIVLVDVETNTPILYQEDFKENNSINDSISNNNSKLDTSRNDQTSINTSTLLQLAKFLAKRIQENDNLMLKGLLKKYHVALVQENVVKMESKIESNNRKYYGIFHPKFVEGVELSDSAKKLKYYLEKCLKGNQHLSTIKLKLSEKFGQKFQLDKNPQINELDKLSKELVASINLSLTMENNSILIRSTTTLKKDIQKLAGHVLKKNKGGCVVFTEDFLNTEKNLAGNLNLLRELIIDKLKARQFTFSNLSKCQFKIHNFFDTESPDVEVELPKEDFVENYNNFTNKTQNTMKKVQCTTTKEIDHGFNNPVNDNVSEIKIIFNQEALRTITSCLTDVSNKQVSFINTDYAAFQIQKIRQIIQSIPMYAKTNGCILVKFKNFLDESHSILEALESTLTHVLLIEHSSSSEKIEGMDKICWKLEDIVQKSSENNPKKVIVIGDTKYLHAFFKFECNIIDEKCVNVLSQLTEESQSTLLQKIKINLYDCQLKLAELMDERALTNIVNTPQLLKQLLERDLVIESNRCHQQQYNIEFMQKETLLVRNGIVIVSGESGSGKSTCLQKLEDMLIKSSKTPTWIVSIHLNKADAIKKLEGQKFKEKRKVIDFLIELLGYQGLRKQMFAASAAGELRLKLVLLLYGFEERLLHPSNDSKMAVIMILKALQLASGITNIYVTCESQSRIELERKLNVFALEVEPFIRQKKLEFMVECLRRYPDSNKADLSKRAEHLLRSYEDKNLTNLINTPLKLKMLVRIHRSKLMSDTPSPIHNVQGDLCKFYERFIDKCNLDLSTRQILDRLSLRRLLTTSELKSLHLDETQPLDEEQIFKNQNNILRHLTIAEYSVARWLSENIDNKEIKSSIVQCIERLIVATSKVFFDTIVQYFQLYNSNERVQHARILIRKGLVNWFRVMLQQRFLGPDLTQVLLRYAVKNNKVDMVRILLNYYRQSDSDFIEFIESKSPAEHGSKSALTLAAEAEHVNMACELMAAGADIKGLKPEFQKMVMRFLFNETFKEQSYYKYVSLLERFVLHESGVVIENLETDREFGKLFTFFLDKGRIKVAICLLKALQDGTVVKPRLLAASLDIVNDNKNIKDEERLEISKLLLGKIDGSLKEHVISILKAAVKHNHPKSFEYFIDHYNPQGCIGFFKHVLLHNDSEALKFMLHNNGKLSKKLSISNQTALNLAVSLPSVNLRLIKLVLDRGDFENGDKSKAENPLSTALKRSADPHLVRYLVERQENLLNTEDVHGMFPWCYVLLNESCRYLAQDQLDLMNYFRSKAKLEVPSNRDESSFVFDKRRQDIARKLNFFQHISSYNLNYEDSSTNNSMPRLHKAVQDNDPLWLAFLLIHGADANVREPKCNRTALHLAVELGRIDMVEHLLQHGAIFDATDNNNKIPLHLASNRQIQLLLQKVADYFYGQNLPDMLRDELSDNVTRDMVQSKSFRYFFNCRDCQGRTLLHVATGANSCNAITKLMIFNSMCKSCNPDQPSLDINARNIDGDTPLHIACRRGYDKVALKLLKYGASFEIEDANGKASYRLALENRYETNIRLFICVVNLFDALKRNEHEIAKSHIEKFQYIVNVKDCHGMTAFHWIVQQKANDLLEFLLIRKSKNHVYLSAVDLAGRTALHIAAEVDNLPAAKLLLKLGLKLDTRDNTGRRAFEYGLPNSKCANMLLDIYRLIEDLNSDKPQILLDKRPENFKKYLKKMEKLYQIEPFVVLNTKIYSKYWNNLPQQAAFYNYRAVLENLLRHGALLPRDIEKIKTGEDTECKKFIRKVTYILNIVNVDDWEKSDLDNKLIAKFRTSVGDTLLHKAVQLKKFREISWLLDKGANPLDTNLNNISALSMAEKRSTPEIVNLLKKVKLDDKGNQ